MIAFTKLIRIIATAISMVLVTSAVAQRTSSVTPTSDIEIVQSTAIYNVGSMAFGNIVPGTTGGTVVLTTSGGTTATGSVHLIAGSSRSAATFVVFGSPLLAYSIQVPSTISLGRSGGSQSMVVSSLTSSNTGGILGSNGSASVTVGGTLTVSASQTSGQYAGSFAVTVSFP
jgi:hypothetical protein